MTTREYFVKLNSTFLYKGKKGSFFMKKNIVENNPGKLTLQACQSPR